MEFNERDFNRQVDKSFTKIDKQIQFATVLTLTWTAKDNQAASEKRISQIIDSPIRRTVKSFFIKPATKNNLESRVFLKDYYYKGTAPSSYLTLFKGGIRPSKRSENALRARGKMTSNQYIVPASIRLNKFGNVTSGMMTKILSGIKSQQDRYQDSAKSKYFVINSKMSHIRKNSMSNGIYQRTARGVKKLFHIVDKAPRIKKIWDFDKFQVRQANKHLNKNMKKALAYAQRTAK